MFYDFQTTTHGKWILAGEHAVLRKNPALVFPVQEKTLILSYTSSAKPLQVICDTKAMEEVLWRTLNEGSKLLNFSLSDSTGCLTLQNDIPIGCGLGASAALCVAVARWLTHMRLLHEDEQLSFARRLEHVFHGKSSGVDIVGAAASGGIYFQNGEHGPLKQVWQPYWYLSFCGEIGLTSHCIQKVNSLWQSDPLMAESIDIQMNTSAALACEALQEENQGSQNKLAQALNFAADCFSKWGLITPALNEHMRYLKDLGAIAMKPTGSGGGGYIVSLWDHPLSNCAGQFMRI